MPGPNLLVSPSAPSRRRGEEERALFARLHRGDENARDAIVRRFLPLARKLARGYPGGAESEDLEQVAAIGLLAAINRFDPDRGLAFSTFAVPTIVGELKRYFRDRAWSVRVPRTVQELALRVERMTVELTGRLGRAPTVAELAEYAGSSVEQVLEALQSGSARRADSLDQPRREGEHDAVTGLMISVEEPGFAQVEDGIVLDGLLRVLEPRARRILELRFRGDLVQSEIARDVGVSQMEVSRSIRQSIEQLRGAADADRAAAKRAGHARGDITA
jgi:RNA polymerase sigma-B factor